MDTVGADQLGAFDVGLDKQGDVLRGRDLAQARVARPFVAAAIVRKEEASRPRFGQNFRELISKVPVSFAGRTR